MRKLTIILVLLLFNALLFAQKPLKVDSLQQRLKETTDPQQKVVILNELARSYQDKDTKLLEKYGQEALAKAQEIDYLQGIVDAYKNIAWAKMVESDYDQATKLLKKSAFFANLQNYTKGQADVYNVLGVIEWYQSNYSQALEYHLKALKAREKLGNATDIAGSYNNIGLIYNKLGENEKSLENYFKALAIHQENNNQTNYISTFYNIATAYEALQKYDSALYYFEKMLKLTEKFGGDYRFGYAFFGLGQVHLQLKNYAQAQVYLEKSLAIRIQLKQEKETAQTLFSLGKLAYNTQQYAQAIRHLSQSLTIAQKVSALDLVRDAAYFLVLTHKASGDFEQAYQYQSLFIQAKDSLFNAEQTKSLTRLEERYSFSKEKDSLQFFQEKERLTIAEERKREAIFQGFTLAGLLIVLMMLVILAYFFKDKQRSNLKLQVANKKLQDYNEEIKNAHEQLNQTTEELVITLEQSEKQRQIIEDKNQNITDSINYAKRIQEAILPSEQTLQQTFFEHFIFFKPRDLVSGDFYWLAEVEGKIILASVDCTGHGVPGAFMSLVANDLLNYIVIEQKITQADNILNLLHKQIRKVLKQEQYKNQDGMDMALVVIEKETKRLEFAGAKSPIVYIQDQQLYQIKGDKMSIGGEQREIERIFTKHQISLKKNTIFYLFSDGIQDQFGGEHNRKFTQKRLRSLLLEHHQKTMSEQKEILQKTIEHWQFIGKESQIDDMLLICVRIEQ